MTLVAAYKINDIPVLIGDVTLSKGNIRSLRKKVYVICHNFAIGWTGHMIVAKTVIQAIKQEFTGNIISKKSLETFFKSFDENDFKNLPTKFIGWIVDEEPLCFLWNCLYPGEVFYHTYYYEGSGEKYFGILKNEKWEEGGDLLPEEDEATLAVINEIARARFEESLHAKIWDNSFGISYDILLFIQGRFKYVPSIIYLGWDYHWDSYKQTGCLKPAPVVIKHNCMGEYSIVQEALWGEKYDGKTINYLSRAVYDDMCGMNLSRFPMNDQSFYYANYFLFREHGKIIFRTLLTIEKISKEGPLRIVKHGGKSYFKFDTDLLDSIYRKHRC